MSERSTLFLVRPDAGLVAMRPSAPTTEDELQALIARYPELIGDSDGELLLIEREAGIPDAAEAAARWSIDHLFVTRSATPVLVEVKRAVDTRLRREVVGQMLDYAANGVAYWPAGTLALRFEASCKSRNIDAETALGAFLPAGASGSDFWAQVEANLRGGRIKLLFVADEIPSELARIVEFLNDQMTADVRAVELAYYEAEGGMKTLAPRIIGETERSRAQKAGVRPRLEPIDIDSWIALNIAPRGEAVLRAARAVLEVFRASGVETGVPSTQGSIFSHLTAPNGRSCYPLFILKNGSVQIAFGYAMTAPGLLSDQVRRSFYDRFVAAVGPLSTPKIDGYPSFPLERLSDPKRLEAFREVASAFFAVCKAPAPDAT
jgi:hypothetical protein